MKKLLVVLLCAILTFSNAYAINGLYPLCGIVTEIDYENDVFYVVDGGGTEWILTECEDWQLGDIVSMIMFNNGTEYIFDDIVIDYRYGGNVSQF